MSTNESSSMSPAVAKEKLASEAQSQQWRAIGIASVAAAAEQASDKREARLKEGTEKRIVTLRDIDHFAA